MDFDPRDYDSRDDERFGPDRERGGRDGSHDYDRDDTRWGERDRDDRERDFDPREVFTRDVRLPRGLEREIVWHRDREYTLRGSESRTLTTVGAFRVVSSRDLRDNDGRSADPRSERVRATAARRGVSRATAFRLLSQKPT